METLRFRGAQRSTLPRRVRFPAPLTAIVSKRENICGPLFYSRASFNFHPGLPAGLYSFHLTVLFTRTLVPAERLDFGPGILSAALFSR